MTALISLATIFFMCTLFLGIHAYLVFDISKKYFPVICLFSFLSFGFFVFFSCQVAIYKDLKVYPTDSYVYVINEHEIEVRLISFGEIKKHRLNLENVDVRESVHDIASLTMNSSIFKHAKDTLYLNAKDYDQVIQLKDQLSS